MVQRALENCFEEARLSLDGGTGGKVATYIPELAKGNPRHLGACIMTADGGRFTAGDWRQVFTMQSISKTITLILALRLAGEDAVFSRIGVEPTGDAFNSIVRLETKTHFPLNPMINAGAIAAAGLCIEYARVPWCAESAHADFLDLARVLCGNEGIGMDERVYLSEKSAGMRNRSMAYMMQGEGVIKCDAEVAVDLYFKMCSTLASAGDLAHYALVLALNGRCPATGVSLADDRALRIVKTLMVTCGMYDGSGEFAIKAGIPGKSGVGGGIIACAENNLGIATFGPALNPKGNSTGGLVIIERLSQSLGLHMFGGNVFYKRKAHT
ncbi:MAG: glutaminase A [Spirochaetes bacterium]|nr:glutaminase A [Spirochaetota bacterium]